MPDSSVSKESTCNAVDPGSIPGLGRSLGEGRGYTPYSGRENYMDCIVHGFTKSQPWLSNFHVHTFHYKTVGSKADFPCISHTIWERRAISISKYNESVEGTSKRIIAKFWVSVKVNTIHWSTESSLCWFYWYQKRHEHSLCIWET